MQYLIVIILAAVLAAQIVLFVMFHLEKQRSDRRYHASLDYTDRAFGSLSIDLHAEMNGLRDLIDENRRKTEQLNDLSDERFKRHNEAIVETRKIFSEEAASLRREFAQEQEKLKLDFAEAQEAAAKINDFGASLSSIFDYDPVEALKKGRRKEVG